MGARATWICARATRRGARASDVCKGHILCLYTKILIWCKGLIFCLLKFWNILTGCLNANLYTSFCFGGQKFASQLWFEGGLGILNSGIFTYDPWIWSKVTSLSSTASVLRDGKISLKCHESIQKKFFFKTSK